MTPQEAIGAAELVEAETAYRLEMAREMAGQAAVDGYERGLVEGYLRAVADFKAFQHAEVRDADLEGGRWGPGGRAHFADPRPGDYPGCAHPEPEAGPEPDLEIA